MLTHSVSSSLSSLFYTKNSLLFPASSISLLLIQRWWQSFIFLRKNKNCPKQMSIFFHKIYQLKCISVPILYLPSTMKCLCFAKTIISSFVLDLFPFYPIKDLTAVVLYGFLQLDQSTALKHALMEPIFKNKTKQLLSPHIPPCMIVLFLHSFYRRSSKIQSKFPVSASCLPVLSRTVSRIHASQSFVITSQQKTIL